MTGRSRLPELPEVPTAAEAGFGNIDARLQWIGAIATAGTPPAVVQKLEAAIRRALADPAVRDKLKAAAYAPDGRGGEEFRQLIDADIKAYADVVRAANLKFDRGAASRRQRAAARASRNGCWLSCNLRPFSVPSAFFDAQQTDAAMR
jgi:hypothetical protein